MNRSMQKRISKLEADFTAWLETEALRDSERAHQLRTLFIGVTWVQILAMAALAPEAGPNLTDEQRKCRIALLLVQAYKRKVAKEQ